MQGDCFPVAAKMVKADPTLFLCHGQPLGQGPIAGIRHDHAWVERDTCHLIPHPLGGEPVPYTATTVLDRSNGKDVELSQTLYYLAGAIDPATVRRYTHDEAVALMDSTGHYGPWEVDG